MIQSAITVSLVPEAKGGPFVFWDGLEDAFDHAARLGFDAVEIFAPGPETIDRQLLKSLVEQSGCQVAAFGTGAGMVKHGLSLTDPDQSRRQQAIEFIQQMIRLGAEFDAPAIIGSMQGRWGGTVDRPTALGYLGQALETLDQTAGDAGVTLIYEPLNRYESNLLNTIAATVEFLETLSVPNVKILADLFHMNIEEANLAAAIRTGGNWINHIHFVDSNRWPAGSGHTDFGAVAEALQEIGFDGVVCAEAFPLPDSHSAAAATIAAFNRYFR